MTTVYVAIVPTHYEIIGVADTEAGAIRAACEKALSYLTEAGAVCSDTETAEKIAEYFGVSATRLDMGTAAFIGN
jgi:hypothetical protein